MSLFLEHSFLTPFYHSSELEQQALKKPLTKDGITLLATSIYYFEMPPWLNKLKITLSTAPLGTVL